MDYAAFMKDLAPQDVFHHFYHLSQIPRDAGDYDGICAFMKAFAEEHGLACTVDAAHNVIIRKAASPGYENKAPVMLTSHLDMVCEKTPDSTHNFKTDPLTLIHEGDIVRADRTTLGADDGIGMAMMMALLANPSLHHPVIEAVFTADEETDMGGALGLDFSQFESRFVINLDGFAVGCSATGEMELEMHLPKSTVAADETLAQYRIWVDGLIGGHTGMEGMQQRGNANLLLNRVLAALEKRVEYQLLDFNGGNGRSSAFATYAVCTVALAQKDVAALEEAVTQSQAGFSKEYAIRDSGVRVHFAPAEERKAQALSPQTQRKLRDLLTIVPDGVFTFSAEYPGHFEGASNLGVVRCEEKEIFLTALIRNAVPSIKDYLADRFFTVCRLLDVGVEIEHDQAGWDKNLSSEHEALLREIYPDQELLHFDGTLECGIFCEGLPGCSVVSLAPVFYEMHSPTEYVHPSEVETHYERLLKLLERL